MYEDTKAFPTHKFPAKPAQLRALLATPPHPPHPPRPPRPPHPPHPPHPPTPPLRRIDSLETMVHQTLGELVSIANEAGVPTGGKARGIGLVIFVFCLGSTMSLLSSTLENLGEGVVTWFVLKLREPPKWNLFLFVPQKRTKRGLPYKRETHPAKSSTSKGPRSC